MKLKPRKRQLWESFSLSTLRRMSHDVLRYAQRRANSITKVNLVRKGHWEIAGRLAQIVRAKKETAHA